MLSENEERTAGRSATRGLLWQAEDAVGAERRLAERVLIDCEVDFASEDTFLFAYATNISALGIFLQTREPEPVGTRMNLGFTVPNGGERLEVEGIVRWINPYRPGDFNNLNPGMGIEFLSLTEPQRELIVDLIRLIAYLA
ncbi:MAG: TIGR02266 family protein [bacterium]